MPTIIPKTKEETWLPRLLPLPVWEPPLTPTLVLAPHPDDETLGAGGLIVKLREQGVPVTVVAITDGENAYDDAKELGPLRTTEQTQALLRLGVPVDHIHRLGLPDRDVTACEDRLVSLLRPFLSERTHVIAPWEFDFHPDHEAAGRAAERAARSLGLSVTSYLFWTWHRGTPDLLAPLSLIQLPLNEAEIERKLYALRAHASQFNHHDGQPILSDELLVPARRTFEVYIQ